MMEKMSLLTAAFTAMLVTAVSGFAIIPALHRMHFGQTIKEIGPTWHAGKNGTPTMGGLTFYLGDVLGVAAGYAVLVLCAPALMGGYFLCRASRFISASSRHLHLAQWGLWMIISKW